MGIDEQPRALSAIVGERLKAFREEKGLRQDDLAEAAQVVGLTWGRSSVASLEGGNRNLSIEELAAIPAAIAKLGGWSEPLLQHDQRISIGAGHYVDVRQFESNLRFLMRPIPGPSASKAEGADEAEVMELGEFFADEITDFEEKRSIARNVLVYDLMAERIWERAFGVYYESGPRELAQKIAERLRRPDGIRVRSRLVALISYGLWGRTANEERDDRAQRRGPYDSPRALQAARGHVTRELIDELQAEINDKIEIVRECEAEVEEAVADEATLAAWRDALDRRSMAHRGIGYYADESQSDRPDDESGQPHEAPEKQQPRKRARWRR